MKNKTDIEILKNMTKQDFNNPMGWSGYYDSELKELQQAIENILADRERLGKMLKKTDENNIKLQKEIETLKNDTYWKGYIDKQNEAIEICKICKYKAKANKYDRLTENMKDRIKSVKKTYETLLTDIGGIKVINVSGLSRKEKEEVLNKRNCLIVQKATYEEVLELLDTQ